jgi:polysaccharide pyruvyl transferase WcaK-like protein
MERRPGPAIGILGHYGNANLGDEAIIQAVVEEIRRRWKHATLYAVSNRPSDTAWRHRIPTVSIHTGELVEAGQGSPHVPRPPRPSSSGPRGMWRQPALRWLRRGAGHVVRAGVRIGAEIASAWRSYRHVRRFDLLLVAGSNQILDNFGGPWEFPYVNLKWSILARLAGCRVAWVSVGAGPLESRLGRWFVRASLSLAHYVSVRDEGSRRLLVEIGVRRPIQVFPDLAHGVDYRPARPAGPPRAPGRPTVAINAMPVYDRRYWHEWSEERSRRYVAELAAVAAALVKDGHGVFFLATHPMDALVADDVVAMIEAEHGQPPWDGDLVRCPGTVSELLHELEAADLVIATRFHGAVLSLRVERPVLAICYYRKTRELVSEFEPGADFAVALDELRSKDLLERVRRLEAWAADLVPGIRRKSHECRGALREQYDRVFRLVSA